MKSSTNKLRWECFYLRNLFPASFLSMTIRNYSRWLIKWDNKKGISKGWLYLKIFFFEKYQDVKGALNNYKKYLKIIPSVSPLIHQSTFSYLFDKGHTFDIWFGGRNLIYCDSLWYHHQLFSPSQLGPDTSWNSTYKGNEAFHVLFALRLGLSVCAGEFLHPLN